MFLGWSGCENEDLSDTWLFDISNLQWCSISSHFQSDSFMVNVIDCRYRYTGQMGAQLSSGYLGTVSNSTFPGARDSMTYATDDRVSCAFF